VQDVAYLYGDRLTLENSSCNNNPKYILYSFLKDLGFTDFCSITNELLIYTEI